MAIINKSLANKYDSTKLYSVNDIVAFANKMYKCITPITVPEEFDSSKWERCYLTDVINQNTNNVNYVAPNYDSNETYLEGHYVLYGGYLYKCLEDDVTGEFDSSKWERCYLTESSLKVNENSNLGNYEFQEWTKGTETTVTVNLGFEPSKLVICRTGDNSNANPRQIIYDASKSTTDVTVVTGNSNTPSSTALSSIGLTVTSTGFSIASASALSNKNCKWMYVAMK